MISAIAVSACASTPPGLPGDAVTPTTDATVMMNLNFIKESRNGSRPIRRKPNGL